MSPLTAPPTKSPSSPLPAAAWLPLPSPALPRLPLPALPLPLPLLLPRLPLLAGTISSVAVAKGAAVNPGDVLCVIG